MPRRTDDVMCCRRVIGQTRDKYPIISGRRRSGSGQREDAPARSGASVISKRRQPGDDAAHREESMTWRMTVAGEPVKHFGRSAHARLVLVVYRRTRCRARRRRKPRRTSKAIREDASD